MQPRLQWITCPKYPEGTPDDRIALEELQSRGVVVEFLDWQQGPPHLPAVFRSPWDYYNNFNRFQNFLNQIRTPVMNPVPLIQWNSDKIYLQELEKKGVRIFPTRFLVAGDDPTASLRQLGNPAEVVLKPAVSAGSFDTYRMDQKQVLTTLSTLKNHASILVQPFAPDVLTEGEFSLIFFKAAQSSPEYSHTIVKKPRSGDFRVQEEFGGSIEAIFPSDDLREFAESILPHIPFDWLYARVDCLRYDGKPCLAELEVFEPQLYFRHSKSSARLFCDAVEHWLA